MNDPMIFEMNFQCYNFVKFIQLSQFSLFHFFAYRVNYQDAHTESDTRIPM